MPSCPDLGPQPPGWSRGHACLGEGNGQGPGHVTLDTGLLSSGQGTKVGGKKSLKS